MILNWPEALFTFVTMEISNRIQEIIKHYGLSASVFADQIGVPRSRISHILSGRNKPSLDFILKTISAFPEVDSYWLLNGKGSFPTPKKNTNTENQVALRKIPLDKNKGAITKGTKKKIARILVCYTDGTFDTYQENETAG